MAAILTPDQEAEVQSRIAAAVAVAKMNDDMDHVLADVASNPGKAKAIAKAAAGVLVTVLAPLAASIPLAPAALALLPELIDQL